ncbi:MAG: tyrosine-type recombinase/integrase [Gammaproteobacteria bacterium]|nr:tyrosine-type recombinase/integrase [Gammaproteobacteria bacterium]
MAATVKVNGVQRELRFPPGTPFKAIRARRDELRASLRTLPRGARQTLASDADRYLEQVTGNLIGSAERRRDVEAWLPKFGHLTTLTLVEHLAALNAQSHDWRRARAASTCNHRRHALLHMVRTLYGRRAAIDLEDLVRFPLPLPRPRWIDRAHIEAVLHHLSPGTKTSARLRLMHWTGMPPSQMGRLTRADFCLADPVPYVSVPRGTGGRLAAIPLVDAALRAVHDFIAADTFGPWSTQSANKAIHAAARHAKRQPFTVYQIRDSFATWLRHAGADLADVQDLYGHAAAATTRIYAAPTLAKQRAAIQRLHTVPTP